MKDRLAIVIGVVALFISSWVYFSGSTEREEVRSIVRKYLLEEPEILVEVGQQLQKKALERQQKEAKIMVAENKDALLNSTNQVLGNPEGDIVLIEFIDYQCGHCKNMGPVIDELIQENPSLKVIIKPLPILGPVSESAAKLALLASQEDQFDKVHHTLLKKTLSEENLKEIAEDHQLDMEKMKNSNLNQKIETVRELAAKLRIRGTPYFVLMDHSTQEITILPGSVSKENMQNVINQMQDK